MELEVTAHAAAGVSAADVLRLRQKALEWREVQGEVVALDLERSEYLLINRSGATLWRLLAAGTSTAEMAQRLAEAYPAAEAAVHADVDAFVAALCARQLLEGAPTGN